MPGRPQDLKAMPVLIVDDEEPLAKLLETILARAGYTDIETVHAGGAALAAVARREHNPTEERPAFGVVVLDIMLPDVTGFDVCLQLKQSVTRFLPVILMTGYHIEDDHARYIESGADDFLRKPIHAAELQARVNLMLNRRATFDLQAQAAAVAKPVARMPQAAPAEGAEIDGYEIEETLSWSGSSIIYKARDSETGDDCVLKILTRHALDYEDVVARFEREAHIQRKLHHPNLVQLIDRGEYDGCPYYVMEHLRGDNLEKLANDQAGAKFDLCLEVALAVAEALHFAHMTGVIHRDVKPKNVFVTGAGEIKLADFGIAVIVGDLRLTQSGYSVGTPVYMAPEQFDGSPVTPAIDIYSYGATLYHLITGEPPFSATNAMEMLRKHLSAPPRPMRELRPSVPAAWDDLVTSRCLAKTAADRPATMAEVKTALGALRDARF